MNVNSKRTEYKQSHRKLLSNCPTSKLRTKLENLRNEIHYGRISPVHNLNTLEKPSNRGSETNINTKKSIKKLQKAQTHLENLTPGTLYQKINFHKEEN